MTRTSCSGGSTPAGSPESASADLARYAERVRYPIAVRSSSLLEDSPFQAVRRRVRDVPAGEPSADRPGPAPGADAGDQAGVRLAVRAPGEALRRPHAVPAGGRADGGHPSADRRTGARRPLLPRRGRDRPLAQRLADRPRSERTTGSPPWRSGSANTSPAAARAWRSRRGAPRSRSGPGGPSRTARPISWRSTSPAAGSRWPANRWPAPRPTACWDVSPPRGRPKTTRSAWEPRGPGRRLVTLAPLLDAPGRVSARGHPRRPAGPWGRGLPGRGRTGVRREPGDPAGVRVRAVAPARDGRVRERGGGAGAAAPRGDPLPQSPGARARTDRGSCGHHRRGPRLVRPRPKPRDRRRDRPA